MLSDARRRGSENRDTSQRKTESPPDKAPTSAGAGRLVLNAHVHPVNPKAGFWIVAGKWVDFAREALPDEAPDEDTARNSNPPNPNNLAADPSRLSS